MFNKCQTVQCEWEKRLRGIGGIKSVWCQKFSFSFIEWKASGSWAVNTSPPTPTLRHTQQICKLSLIYIMSLWCLVTDLAIPVTPSAVVVVFVLLVLFALFCEWALSGNTNERCLQVVNQINNCFQHPGVKWERNWLKSQYFLCIRLLRFLFFCFISWCMEWE